MHAPWHGIRRQLLAAFAGLIAILAIASGLSTAAHREVHALLEEVAQDEEGIEAALRLSAAVRDAYAHQAHSIILDNRTHLHHYDDAQADVAAWLASARSYARDDGDRKVLDEIEAVAARMDRNFQESILPAIPGNREALVKPHDEALRLVERIVAATDRLTARYEARVAEARARADRADRESSIRSAVLIGLGLLVGVLVTVFVDRSIAGPVKALEAGARRLARGELDTRIPVDRRDELGSLAHTFNEMAGELAARQEKLVRSETLAGLGRMAAGVAHEINNPLGVILGHGKLLARSGDPTVAADARVILEEVERCRDIVAGLLDLSRPQTLRLSPVSLGELVRDVAERLPGAGLDARIEVAERAEATVEADADKLRQIVWNLLRNGAEAAPGGTLHVEIARAGDAVELAVADEGPGVADKSRLFEPFFTTKAKGTGLGLAVSAALARAHGGSLALGDAPRGARFVLTLPARAA